MAIKDASLWIIVSMDDIWVKLGVPSLWIGYFEPYRYPNGLNSTAPIVWSVNIPCYRHVNQGLRVRPSKHALIGDAQRSKSSHNWGEPN